MRLKYAGIVGIASVLVPFDSLLVRRCDDERHQTKLNAKTSKTTTTAPKKVR